MIRSLHRAIALAAMLISAIDSNAMAKLSQQYGTTGFLPAYVSPVPQGTPVLQRDGGGSQSSSERAMAISIAPPAVMVVERANLVHLREDIDDALFGDTSASPSYRRFWRSSAGSPNDSLAFELDLGPLSRDSITFSASLIILISVALGLTASWAFGRPLQVLATAFREVASDCLPAEAVPEQGPKSCVNSRVHSMK